MSAKKILKGFKPERNHFGQLIFVDEKLRVFANSSLPKLFKSTRKGFLIEVDERGGFKPLNPYKDPHNEILPRTLDRLLRDKHEIDREIKKRQREEKNNRAVNPAKIIPTALADLPRRVVVLDIETTGELNELPHPKRISVVGLKEFELVAGGFQPLPFEHFDGADDWSSLKSRLSRPIDIILGHNLFGFDYYFLERVLDLQQLVPKTVDLLLWLCTCVGSHRGTGLDRLCRLNFGIWKLRSGKSAKQLSSLADKLLLHRYNERDLDLTFRLWLHAVEQKKIKTWASGFLKAGAGDLDYLLGRKCLVDYALWLQQRRAWGSNQPSPLNSSVIAKKLGAHDTDSVTWPTYSVIVCGNCKSATVYLVSESYQRIVGKADEPPQRVANRELKTYKLRCATCNDSIRSRSSTLPTQIGNFEINEQRKRLDNYWSPMLHCGADYLLSPFGKTWEELFHEFKLGRRDGSSTTFERNPARREAELLSAAVSDEHKRALKFNEKRSIYLLFERGTESGCLMLGYLKAGLDSILENHWQKDTSWINSAGIGKDFCCQTCGRALTIHDLPLVHPVFRTPLCQSCIRLGRHRYFHHGKWMPDLKRRRFQFSDALVPTNGAWNLTAFFARQPSRISLL